jgi:thiol-disulfide isomerase/thioredoxin
MANINWKFISFNWKFVSIMIAVLLLILAIFYVFKNYVQPKMDPDYVANREYIPGDQREDVTEYIDVLMFTVDWCPHCKKAKPVWNEFAGTYDQKVVNGYQINVKTINCTNDEDSQIKSLLDKYNIEGFPTIKAIKDGKVYDYDAKPETDSLKQFLDMLTN